MITSTYMSEGYFGAGTLFPYMFDSTFGAKNIGFSLLNGTLRAYNIGLTLFDSTFGAKNISLTLKVREHFRFKVTFPLEVRVTLSELGAWKSLWRSFFFWIFQIQNNSKFRRNKTLKTLPERARWARNWKFNLYIFISRIVHDIDLISTDYSKLL